MSAAALSAIAMRCSPATASALAAVVYGGAPLDRVEIHGDRSLAGRFTRLFELPPRAA